MNLKLVNNSIKTAIKSIDISKILNQTVAASKANAPILLTAAGIGFTVTALILTAKNAPVVKSKIESYKETNSQSFTPKEYKDILEDNNNGKFDIFKLSTMYSIKYTKDGYDRKELIKLTFKDVCIPVAFASAGICCFIFANKISNDKLLAATTLYEISRKEHAEYKEEAEKLLGKKKTEQLEENLANKAFENAQQNDILSTPEYGDGLHDTFFVDSLTGRTFKSNWAAVDAAIDKFHLLLEKNRTMPLNEFFENMLGLDGCKVWDDVGISVDECARCCYAGFDMRCSATTSIDGRIPAFKITYDYLPEHIMNEMYY